MDDRRTFLKKSSLFLLALSAPTSLIPVTVKANTNMATTDPKTAVVFWYSQTGNTERTGRLIAETLKKKGLDVTAVEYRDLDQSSLNTYDMVVAGSPVYYYDVPENFKLWLSDIPEISGKPCASYVTFGGTGGNQHNTACTLVDLLADKGGVPVGIEKFGNMSTFAITWSYGNVERVLKYSHLPDDISYDAMRDYASVILDRVHQGQGIEIEKDCDYRELFKNTPSIWSTKLFITNHTIDENKCIECGTCIRKCPVGAIELEQHLVDTDRCIACLGCVNNCPAQAFNMAFMGEKIYGYYEFLKQNNIQINLPEELKES